MGNVMVNQCGNDVIIITMQLSGSLDHRVKGILQYHDK